MLVAAKCFDLVVGHTHKDVDSLFGLIASETQWLEWLEWLEWLRAPGANPRSMLGSEPDLQNPADAVQQSPSTPCDVDNELS